MMLLDRSPSARSLRRSIVSRCWSHFVRRISRALFEPLPAATPEYGTIPTPPSSSLIGAHTLPGAFHD